MTAAKLGFQTLLQFVFLILRRECRVSDIMFCVINTGQDFILLKQNNIKEKITRAYIQLQSILLRHMQYKEKAEIIKRLQLNLLQVNIHT